MDFITSSETIRSLCRRLAPSLVSLLGAEVEIQYVALKCISLIVQKRSNVLDREIRVFFCKYNDPIYVKLEKIEVMVQLADQKNIDQVIHELKDYATEVDVEFVKKAVRAIGRCAVKLERAVDRCISCLLDLINMRVNYVVQEAIIVIRDVFRRYPNRYEMIIKDLFANLETLDNPEAKAAIIWIIGEYSERIDDATAQLGSFFENFLEEPSQVQNALLTATVKLFLKKPEEAEGLVSELLAQATEAAGNYDLRDRAYIYWRLLSTDPDAARDVVLGNKPTISEDTTGVDSALIDKFIEEIGKLSSCYHKPAEVICPRRTEHVAPEAVEEEEKIEFDSSGQLVGQNTATLDLLELGLEDTSVREYATIPLHCVFSSESKGVNGNSGVSIEMAFQKYQHDQLVLECKLGNCSPGPLSDWAMQFNLNFYGLAMGESLQVGTIEPGNSVTSRLEVNNTGTPDTAVPSVPFVVQMAVKNSLDVFYFQTPCMFTVLLVEGGRLSKEEFKDSWQNKCEANEFSHTQEQLNPAYHSVELVKKRLEENLIYLVAGKDAEAGEFVGYYSCRDVKGQVILSEIRIPCLVNSLELVCKTPYASIAPLFIQGVNFLLSTN